MIRRLSRRSFIGLSALGGVALLGRAGPALAQAKVSKQQAKYQDSPKGDHKCGECEFFIPENKCQRVTGEISPDGWCTFYTPKV